MRADLFSADTDGGRSLVSGQARGDEAVCDGVAADVEGAPLPRHRLCQAHHACFGLPPHKVTILKLHLVRMHLAPMLDSTAHSPHCWVRSRSEMHLAKEVQRE